MTNYCLLHFHKFCSCKVPVLLNGTLRANVSKSWVMNEAQCSYLKKRHISTTCDEIAFGIKIKNLKKISSYKRNITSFPFCSPRLYKIK